MNTTHESAGVVAAAGSHSPQTRQTGFKASTMMEHDPLWYKDAVIYQLHVRAFCDSSADGIGDFRGLTEKLDYLHDLGVTAIWLLPFYPSPLKDDGYDISDYTGIHPDFGTLRDFRRFLEVAHDRGLRVIIELVLNHTSDQHPWFQRARRSPPGSSHRNFYVWSDTPEKYKEARIIFKDFEHSNWTWDPVAKAYYWHRFYSHQPDLNYDNPEVVEAIVPLLDFWLDMGVDGLRLDAVPYLYEREGTNCENLPETHAFLKMLRRHVDERYPGRMLLAEANQWPEDAVAYFGQGDECHMAFHFPIMPRMFMAIHMEDRFPIMDIMAQTPPIPDSCQWTLFLRNHDELTLEMVTDEERDYMYRAYARDPRARLNLGIRRRLAPLLDNNRRRIELMNGLLFSMPGTPIIYYGDEIGMGDNIYLGDRNGVRTPMQWSGDRNAGFSRANPQKLYLPVIIDPEYHYEAINVETQQNNPSSMLWWMKRMIALRKQSRAFSRGSLHFLKPDNRKILAFLRRYEDECILVVANLSRFVQYVELDLSEFRGCRPVELFGRTPFPRIGELPYLLTLGPHEFYWFLVEAEKPSEVDVEDLPRQTTIPTLSTRQSWDELFQRPARIALERILPAYLQQRRWFGSKARTIKSAAIQEAVPLPYADTVAYITLIEVTYNEGEPESYVLPVAFADQVASQPYLDHDPHAVLTKLQGAVEGVIYDALCDTRFCSRLLSAVAENLVLECGDEAELVASRYSRFDEVHGPGDEPLIPFFGRAEQSNTSIIYGGRVIAKVFRRIEAGLNPDLEIGRYLTEECGFPHSPPVIGAIEYRRFRAEPLTLAIFQGYVPNQGDAWQYTLDTLSSYYEQALARSDEENAVRDIGDLLDLIEADTPVLARETIGPYLEAAALLGRRTAEMHNALARPTEDPNFAPEPMSVLYLRSIYQSMRSLTGRVLHQLQRKLPSLPEDAKPLAQTILASEAEIFQRFRAVTKQKIEALRTRCHGDYHLGQVLYTGKDFLIIDFEGEPARSITERRLKRSPLRDIAGMIRSFHYAAYGSLKGDGARRGGSAGVIRPEDVPVLEPWARYWFVWVSATFLRSYLELARRGDYLPRTQQQLTTLLQALLLEKAVYEVGYELNSRPDWVGIPLLGVEQLLRSGSEAQCKVE